MRPTNVFSGFLMRASAVAAIFMAAMVVSDV